MGLTVDWSGVNPVIYVTIGNSAANKLIKITDEGATSAAVELATAPANTVFRGVAFAPSNVPTSVVSPIKNKLKLTNKSLIFDVLPSTSIEIYSVTGNKVASYDPAMRVDLDLSKGIYIVKVNKVVSKIILK